MQKTKTQNNENLTAKEVMQVLRCGRTTVWKLTTTGQLENIKTKGKILVPRRALKKYLEERTR